MKIDVSKVLMSIRNEPLKINADTDATLKWAIVESLMGAVPKEDIDTTEKMKRFKLSQKIESAEKEVDISVEDVAKIKEVVGKFFPINVVGAVFSILDPD